MSRECLRENLLQRLVGRVEQRVEHDDQPFGTTHLPTGSRETAKIQPKYSREAAERQPRGSREAAAMLAWFGAPRSSHSLRR